MKRIKNKNSVLYSLLFSQALSLVGTRMTTVALSIWLYQETGLTTSLLLLPFFNELPSLLFGHFLGVFVDRHDRGRLMVLADAGQGLGSLLLFWLIWSGQFLLWHLYLVVFVQGIFSSLQAPAADASITLLTTAKNRGKINGIKEMTFPAAGVLAPILAGILYVTIGISGVLIVDLVTFMIGSTIVLFLDMPKASKSNLGQAYEGSFFKEALSGYRFLKSQRALFNLVVYFALVNVLINGPLELVIPYVMARTGSEILLSTMLSLMSVATFVGASLMMVIGNKKRLTHWLFAVMILSSAGFLVFGQSQAVSLLAMGLVMIMLPLPILNALFKTILQSHTPEDMQGRVFSVVYQGAYGIAPLSFLITGPLVDRVLEPRFLALGQPVGTGMGALLTLTGLILLFITMVYFYRLWKANL